MQNFNKEIKRLDGRVQEIVKNNHLPRLNEIAIISFKIYMIYVFLMKKHRKEGEISKYNMCPLYHPPENLLIAQVVKIDCFLCSFIMDPSSNCTNQSMLKYRDGHRLNVIKILCRAENYLLYSKKIPHVTRQHFERVKKGNVGDFQSFLAEKLLRKLAKLM